MLVPSAPSNPGSLTRSNQGKRGVSNRGWNGSTLHVYTTVQDNGAGQNHAFRQTHWEKPPRHQPSVCPDTTRQFKNGATNDQIS